MGRSALVTRNTKETQIRLSLDLDNDKDQASKIKTPIPFLDHMLDVFTRHGRFFLDGHIDGDIEVDFHHTVEDTGICLGTAFQEALGDKRGIERYGLGYVPMDEALVRTVVDLSGRSYFVCHMGGHQGNVGDFNMEHCKHFFRSLTDNLQMNCHIEVISGDDTHHVIEAVFKSAAKALRQAVQITGKAIPSTKGSL